MGIFTRKVETEIDRTFQFCFSKYGILWILKLWSVNIIAWLRFTSMLLISKYLSYKIYTLNSNHVKLEPYEIYTKQNSAAKYWDNLSKPTWFYFVKYAMF